MSKDTNQTANSLVFFLIGAAVGAGVALLYAPNDGSQTRKLIGEKAIEAKDKAAEVTENVSNTAKEKWTAVAGSVSELVSHVPRLAPRDGNAAEVALDGVPFHSSS